MRETLTLIYNSVDVVIAFALGIWFISTKGKLTKADKPTHNFSVKWIYFGGYLAILYGIINTIKIFL